MINQAIILAGGKGSRLKSITKGPKPTLVVRNNEPHLLTLLKYLYLHGVTKIIILVRNGQTDHFKRVTTSLPEQFLRILNISYHEEVIPMDTGGWIIHNSEYLEEQFLVCNADTIYTENISSSIFDFNSSSFSYLITSKCLSRDDVGQVFFNEEKIITAFAEKCGSSLLPSYESLGIYLFKKSHILEFRDKINNANPSISLEAKLIPYMVQQSQVKAFNVKNTCIDYGTPIRLNSVKELDEQLKYKWLLLDRDNTLNIDKGYTFKLDDFTRIFKLDPLIKAYQDSGYFLAIITNQSGISRGIYTIDQMELFNTCLRNSLKENKIMINHLEFCPHTPEELCECRKPSPGMILNICKLFTISINHSILIGDKNSDVECGKKLGISTMHFTL